MSEPLKAVFLSYASQDAAAAQRICDSLRAAGIEVWFDQNELVGGDAWDAKIRKQIAECALFVPIISASTQARREGYFRLEWKLAAQRTHMIADGTPFLIPVVVDGTGDADALVPAEFRAVQWSRLRPAGDGGQARPEIGDPALEKFCERVKKLLGGDKGLASGRQPDAAGRVPAPPQTQPRTWRMPAVFAAALLVAAAAYFGMRPTGGPPVPPQPVSTSGAAAARSAPPTEAQRLARQARALIDDDPFAVRESFKSAIELCERATQLSPEEGEAWATLARANLRLATEYREDTELRRASLRSQVERAIRLAPDSVEAGVAMAGYELNFDDNVGAARARLLRLIERAPADRRVLRMLVSLEEDRGQDVAEARRWTERANLLSGGDAGTWLSLAWVHWGRNEFPQVREAVERSLAIQPMTESCQLRLLLYVQSGDFDGARSYLRKLPAVILREDRTAMIVYEVQLYSGDYDGAMRTIAAVPREFLEEGLFYAARGYLAGRALTLAGKTNAAKVEFSAALKAIDARLNGSPRDLRAAYQRAMVLACLGETAKAEQQFAVARELGRDDWLDVDACVLLGRFEEALASFDALIDRARTRWPGRLRYLKYDPLYQPLRATAKGREIIARGDQWLAEMLRSGESGAAVRQSPVDEKSVAVLAFADLSPAHDSEYFSDGISEELLNVLAKVPGLKVTARTSAFSFKGKNVAMPEIGRQLGVSYVVEGSVRKAGDRVRITAQLIKAADGFHVWSENFDRELKDVFAVQDEIAGLIAKNLSLKLGANPSSPKAAVNPQAFELYMQARQAWNRRTPDGYDRAEKLLEQVLTLEPNFARAHAGLVDVWLFRAQDAGSLGRFDQRNRPELARIVATSRQALALDGESAEAHASLGLSRWFSWDFAEGERELRQAIALNPNYASAHQWLGRVLLCEGVVDEALRELQLATVIDPLAPRILDNCGWALAHAGRHTEALAMFERALALQPDGAQTLANKANELARRGRRDEAVATARRIPAQASNYSRGMRIVALARAGVPGEAEAMLAGADTNLEPYRVAAWLALGRPQDALAALNERAIGITVLQDWMFDPLFDPLRTDPRFTTFLGTLGLTEAHARAQAWRAAHPPEKP